MTQRTSDPEEGEEQKALRALAWMVEQYLRRDDGTLDNVSMSAGELAFEVLAEQELLVWMDDRVRFASWTDKGRRLLRR